MYDIVFVSPKNNRPQYNTLCTRYPTAKFATSFEQAQRKALSDMFYVVWDDLAVSDTFNFDYEVPEWDKKYVHTFLNDSYYDGICLVPKNVHVSSREIKHRFFVNKKEVDIVASMPAKYDVFDIDTYEDYENALEKCNTNMFWCIWKNVEVTKSVILTSYFSHHNSYDRNENHVYKNLCNDEESYHGGIVLASINKPLSKREVEHRFLINRKEVDVVASRYRYPRHVISSYEEYEKVLANETSPLFWLIWDNVSITGSTIFDLYYNPTDGRYDADREMHHVYQHLFRGEETYHNGVVLSTTKHQLGRREFNSRYVVTRKEHKQLVSEPLPYDVAFISYKEPNAIKHFEKLQNKIRQEDSRINLRWVRDVKGIHQAHKKAAELSTTRMFFVVDGDADMCDDFTFDYQVPVWDETTVHVWRSINPVNGLQYGNGGVKLLPRLLTQNVDVNTTDMTTSISDRFKVVDQLSNYTVFNTNAYNTWKSAFRECTKLASKSITGQIDDETEDRLQAWLHPIPDASFRAEAKRGAEQGTVFGKENKNKPEVLALINDFDWLEEKFNDQ